MKYNPIVLETHFYAQNYTVPVLAEHTVYKPADVQAQSFVASYNEHATNTYI